MTSTSASWSWSSFSVSLLVQSVTSLVRSKRQQWCSSSSSSSSANNSHCSTNRLLQVSQNNMLLLGVVQMVIGVLIVGSSFSAFFLSNFPAAIHNTSPYWAGLSGLLCGAVGVIAWKHNSMFTTTFYALLSSLCIVLNLLGAVLTSKISQNLVPIKNCPCFCCTSPDGCGAYFLQNSNIYPGDPSDPSNQYLSSSVNKLPNRTHSLSALAHNGGGVGGTLSSFNNARLHQSSQQQQHMQYVKPLPTCEQEAETLRALMIVLCIENCLACAIATLSTVISLLLIAKNKTPLGVSVGGNGAVVTTSEVFPTEDNARTSSHHNHHHQQISHRSQRRGTLLNDTRIRSSCNHGGGAGGNRANVGSSPTAGGLSGGGGGSTFGSLGMFDPHLDPHLAGTFSRATCPWVLWHAEMQALLPPPYLPPPYTTSDNPCGFGAPFILLNGPGFEVCSWETDSLPPPYSSCDLVTSCRIRGASPEITTSAATGGGLGGLGGGGGGAGGTIMECSRGTLIENSNATTASCSSVLSHTTLNNSASTNQQQNQQQQQQSLSHLHNSHHHLHHHKKPNGSSAAKRYNWYDQNTLHRSLRPSKSLENMRRVQPAKFRSTHYLYRYHPISVVDSNADGSATTTTQQSIVMVYKQNRLRKQRRFGSDGALQRVGFWHEVSKPNRKFKSTSTLTGLRHLNSSANSNNSNSISSYNGNGYSRTNHPGHSLSSVSLALPSNRAQNERYFVPANRVQHSSAISQTSSSIAPGGDFLIQTEGFINDGSRAIQTLSTQIASAGVSALEKLMTIKNHLTGSLRSPQATTSYYSALVNERINEETASQANYEDMSECSISLQESESAEVFLKDEQPSFANCDYVVELPPVLANSSSSESCTSDQDDIFSTTAGEFKSTDVDDKNDPIKLTDDLITPTASPFDSCEKSKNIDFSIPLFVDISEPMLMLDSESEIGSPTLVSTDSNITNQTEKVQIEPDISKSREPIIEITKPQNPSLDVLNDSANNLPPSRYDYPAFLTIPVDQPSQDTLKASKLEDKNVLESSTSISIDIEEIPTIASPIEIYSTENSSCEGVVSLLDPPAETFKSLEKSVRSQMRIKENTVQFERQFAHSSDYGLSSHFEQNERPYELSLYKEDPNNGELFSISEEKRRKTSSDERKKFVHNTLSAPTFTSSGRRFSSSDYDSFYTSAKAAFDRASGSRSGNDSSKDYELRMSMVANRETEYIRKHRSRYSSVGAATSDRVQAHSSANIYMSLLNIIQQSQSLITDLALHYQHEIEQTSPSPVITQADYSPETVFWSTESPGTEPAPPAQNYEQLNLYHQNQNMAAPHRNAGQWIVTHPENCVKESFV